MRVAIVINTSWNVYNFRRGLVKTLLKEQHQVIIIAPKDDYSNRLIEWGCEFIPLQMENKGTNPIQDLFLLFHIKKQYKKANADVFLQYTIKPNIYGSLAAKMLRKPTICNVSGLGTIFIHPKRISSKIGVFLYKIAFRFPKKVFFQNSDDKQLFIDNNLLKNNITEVLPGSGVDLNYFKNLNKFNRNSPFKFLMISRMLIDKGIYEYVNAAALVIKNNTNVVFQILGKIDDSTGSIPKKELELWKTQNIIQHLGETDDVKKIIEEADCIVLPSYREGTPRTLLEAMALNKPIIATNVPGCKETVINEKNGYLCEVKSEKSLKKSFLKILNLSNQELEIFGLESRKLAEKKFDEQIIIKKYLDTINEIHTA